MGWKELEGCVRVSFSHLKTEVACRVWGVMEFTRKSGNAVKTIKTGGQDLQNRRMILTIFFLKIRERYHLMFTANFL